MSKSTQYDHEEQSQETTDQVTAPCPLCGATVSVSQVYDGEGCYACNAPLSEMQAAARGENHE